MNADRDNLPDSEVLLGRVIDGEATDADVRALEAAAERDPGVVRLLAEMQRDARSLRSALRAELDSAERIALPLTVMPQRPGRGAFVETFRPWLAYTGWAAAIVLLLLVVSLPQDAPSVQVVDYDRVSPHIVQTQPGEPMGPVLLRVEEIPDGRWRWTWIERELREVVTDAYDPEWVRAERDRREE